MQQFSPRFYGLTRRQELAEFKTKLSLKDRLAFCDYKETEMNMTLLALQFKIFLWYARRKSLSYHKEVGVTSWFQIFLFYFLFLHYFYKNPKSCRETEITDKETDRE